MSGQLNTSLIFTGLLFGSIGMGYFIYGKRQQEPVPMICGLLLMGIPYLIVNVTILAIASIALMALPFLL